VIKVMKDERTQGRWTCLLVRRLCQNLGASYRTFIFNQAVGDPESSGITVQVK